MGGAFERRDEEPTELWLWDPLARTALRGCCPAPLTQYTCLWAEGDPAFASSAGFTVLQQSMSGLDLAPHSRLLCPVQDCLYAACDWIDK